MTLEITDHAVLRYVERVMGVDIEAVRARIAATPGLAAAVAAGAMNVTIDGVHYEISRTTGAVVTVTRSRSGEQFRRQGRTINGGKVKAGARYGRGRGDNRKPIHLPQAEVDEG